MPVNFVSLWMMTSMNQMFDAQTFLSISETVLKIMTYLLNTIYIYIYICSYIVEYVVTCHLIFYKQIPMGIFRR